MPSWASHTQRQRLRMSSGPSTQGTGGRSRLYPWLLGGFLLVFVCAAGLFALVSSTLEEVFPEEEALTGFNGAPAGMVPVPAPTPAPAPVQDTHAPSHIQENFFKLENAAGPPVCK